MVVDAPRLRWWLILNLIILPLRGAAIGPALLVDLDRRRLAAAGHHPPPGDGPGAGARGPVEPANPRGRGHALRRSVPGPRPVLAAPAGMFAGPRAADVPPVFADHGGHDGRGGEIRPARRPIPIQTRIVEGYATHPGYIDALAASIRDARAERRHPAPLVMSFHGLPQRYADAGDPYPDQCRATAEATAARLGLQPSQWFLCFQSRFGRGEWLQPATDRTLAGLGSEGSNGVDVVCPGFAADCLETLEEVAIANRRLYESAGGRGFRYIAALNDRTDHIEALADVALEHLDSWEEGAGRVDVDPTR